MAIEPGTQIGRYEIQRKLGGGGMGMVYVAHDPVLGRMVAIKMFKADFEMPDAGSRFSREARSAALLNHPNIVTVYDFGEVDSQPYIVMEYVAGDSLAELIRRKAAIAVADKLRWMEELCAGASYAHRMSIVHRDIKPANLMIDKSGRLKILDFGIARMAGTSSTASAVAGTPGYMAPEQFQEGPLDPRADVFAIGAVFYELMALVEAFPGNSFASVMHRVLSVEPAPLRQLLVDCHPEIAAVCERALMKDRDQRFPSADAMREAISHVRNELDVDAGLTIFPARTETPTPPPLSAAATAVPTRQTDGGTPPEASGQRRTDREAVARRRRELLDTALRDTRSEMQRGRFDAALAACQRALAIDETNQEALDLEERIHRSLDSSTDTVPIDESEPTIGAFSSAPPTPGPNERFDQTVLRVPMPRNEEADRTILVRPRHAPSAPPASGPLPATPAPATPGPTPEARPIARQPAGSGAVSQGKSPLRVSIERVRTLARGRERMLLAGVVAAVALLALIGVALQFTGGPAPTGLLVIDAVPWARVTAIEASDGRSMPLPDATSTPLKLSLPAGTYKITLTGPGSDTKEVQAAVEVDGLSLAQPAMFSTISVDEYFERYLGPPDTAEPATAATPTAPSAASSSGSRP